MSKKASYGEHTDRRTVTRRDFLRTAGIIGAGAILSACAPSATPSVATPGVATAGVATPSVAQKGPPPVQPSYTKDWIAQQLKQEGRINFRFPAGSNFHQWMSDFFMPKFSQRILDTYGVNLDVARLETAGGDDVFYQKIQAFNEASGKPGEFDIDVAKVAADFRLLDGIDKGWFMPILPQYAALAPNLADIAKPEFTAYESKSSFYAVPIYQPTVAMWYNGDKVPNPPQTIQELGDWIKANPGKFLYEDPRADTAGNQFLLTVLHATGNEVDSSTWDKGWTFLKGIEPNVYPSHPDNGDQTLELMRRGEIWMMCFWNDWAVFYRSAQSVPFMKNYYLTTGGPIRNTPWVIPAGAQHPVSALLFVDYSLSPEVQSNMATAMHQIPANMGKATWATLPADSFGFPYQTIVDRTFPAFNSRPSIDAIKAMTDGWVKNVLGK